MDFHDLVNQFISVMAAILTTLVTGFVSILFLKLKKKWGLEIDESQRAQLTNAIDNGIAYAAQQIEQPSQAQTVTITKEYVQSNAPDAVAHFGADVNSPQLEKKIISQLPAATQP